MDQLHTPERLENETMEAYRSRRRVGKLLARMCRTLTPDSPRYRPSPDKVYRRQLVATAGRRQAVKYVKFLRAMAKLGRASKPQPKSLSEAPPRVQMAAAVGFGQVMG
jgi:hypothetical protein